MWISVGMHDCCEEYSGNGKGPHDSANECNKTLAVWFIRNIDRLRTCYIYTFIQLCLLQWRQAFNLTCFWKSCQVSPRILPEKMKSPTCVILDMTCFVHANDFPRFVFILENVVLPHPNSCDHTCMQNSKQNTNTEPMQFHPLLQVYSWCGWE